MSHAFLSAGFIYANFMEPRSRAVAEAVT